MKKGFTLIELLVVVLIIAILAAVALPQYQTAVLKSRAAGALPMIKAIYDAQDRYYLANDELATTFKQLDVSPAPGCTADTCAIGNNSVWLSTTGINFYINSTSPSTDHLSFSMYFDTDTVNFKKGQITCYDRGKEQFAKVCKSLGATKSFDHPTPPGSKAWVISGGGS
ncbi:prepilin-type N-terminal cleavage/methylation domain-containing protein [Parelusimicrobium proximum]|uniref:type IV pilin protein n=1 Tax=Parelusimicrobium proximum TaxID=3228953 RepID=UPI003D184E7A